MLLEIWLQAVTRTEQEEHPMMGTLKVYMEPKTQEDGAKVHQGLLNTAWLGMSSTCVVCPGRILGKYNCVTAVNTKWGQVALSHCKGLGERPGLSSVAAALLSIILP